MPDNEFSAFSILNGYMFDMDIMYHHYVKDYETTDYKTWKKKHKETECRDESITSEPQ